MIRMESVTDPGLTTAPVVAPTPARSASEGQKTLAGASGWTLLPWSASTALLLYLSHFPVAWGWLGWVALVPLLVLVRSRVRTWGIFFAGWFAGLAFFFPVLQWM